MASLLLRNVMAASVTSARFLSCSTASRLFSSWLVGRSKTASPLQTLPATKPCHVDLLPFLTSCPPLSLQPVAGMKCKVVIKRRCKDCFIVRRRGHLYVYCKTHPRHKQRKF
ncbi:large ribosomal subunit protein bL36m [Zootoca vivipara]|uniref:large ribosomal subunit protein bL36m n=1 Tax=Zootoca vivipara TaxID=8524 RepID=UPI00293BAB3C|nr:large ribosomal subunit protein bL36m [Zootoca vivipara]